MNNTIQLMVEVTSVSSPTGEMHTLAIVDLSGRRHEIATGWYLLSGSAAKHSVAMWKKLGERAGEVVSRALGCDSDAP